MMAPLPWGFEPDIVISTAESLLLLLLPIATAVTSACGIGVWASIDNPTTFEAASLPAFGAGIFFAVVGFALALIAKGRANRSRFMVATVFGCVYLLLVLFLAVLT